MAEKRLRTTVIDILRLLIRHHQLSYSNRIFAVDRGT